MSTLMQISQVLTEKERVPKPKMQLHSEAAELFLKPSCATTEYGQILPPCALTNNQMICPPISLMPTKGTTISDKERALILVHSRRTIQKSLRLKVGVIKELTNGVFVKKRPNGVLELYISEE